MLKNKNKLVGKVKTKVSLKGKLNNSVVYVQPITQEKTVIPNKNIQEIIPDDNYTGLKKVIVESIPDEYIIPDGTLEVTENTIYDVTPYSKVSARVYPTPNLQDKEATPNNETQNITFDSEYDGLNRVTINPIPDEYIIPTGTLEITENGEHNVKDYEKVITDIHEITPYAPKFISFRGYTYSDLDYEITNLDTSNMDNMSNMFNGCSQLKELDLNHFNTSNVFNMQYMFDNCKQLETIELSDWNTSKVTNMDYMFRYCNKLKNIDVSNFDTSNVSNMMHMFNSCELITELDLSNWNVEKVSSTQYMFNNCYALTTLNCDNWNTLKLTTISNMFRSCKALKTINIKNLNTELIKSNSSSYYVFQYCTSLETIDLSGWNTSNMINVVYFFDGCTSLKNVNVSNWNVSKVTAFNYMFQNCSALETLDLSGWVLNTSSTVNMLGVFNGCTSLKHLDIRQWDTSRIGSYTDIFKSIPTDCEIIVKDDTAKTWVLTQRSDFTNIKTVAEIGG